jgi:hypothetical protein
MVNQKHLSFLNLSEELLPYLEQKKYRVAPFKMIAGHTTAGFLNFIYSKKIHF